MPNQKRSSRRCRCSGEPSSPYQEPAAQRDHAQEQFKWTGLEGHLWTDEWFKDQRGPMLLTIGETDQWTRPDSAQMNAAFKEAPAGKRLPDSLYLHASALDTLPELLYQQLERALAVVQGEDSAYDLVKFAKNGLSVSLLSYPEFMSDPHPALEHATTINLETSAVRRTDYSQRQSPPILHRKEAFLSPDHPKAPEFRKLTKSEEAKGLLSQPSIGTRGRWEELLSEEGLAIEDHELRTATAQDPWRNLDQDVRDAFQHFDQLYDDAADPDNFTAHKTMIAINEIPDDLYGWLEVEDGELAGASREEVLEWARDYRGDYFADIVADILDNGFPAIVVADGDEVAGVGDGRGRVNLAVALGMTELPAVILREKATPRTASATPAVGDLVSSRDYGGQDALYHWTTRDNLPDILQHGLRPGCGDNWEHAGTRERCQDRVFFSAEPDKWASSYRDPVAVRVPTDDVACRYDGGVWVGDELPESFWDQHGERLADCYAEDAIPPELIEPVTDEELREALEDVRERWADTRTASAVRLQRVGPNHYRWTDGGLRWDIERGLDPDEPNLWAITEQETNDVIGWAETLELARQTVQEHLDAADDLTSAACTPKLQTRGDHDGYNETSTYRLPGLHEQRTSRDAGIRRSRPGGRRPRRRYPLPPRRRRADGRSYIAAPRFHSLGSSPPRVGLAVTYRVVYTSRAAKDLRKSSSRVKEDVDTAIPILQQEPRGGEGLRYYQSLTGNKWLHGVRVGGDHRMVYAIFDDERLVEIQGIGPRDKIYKLIRKLKGLKPPSQRSSSAYGQECTDARTCPQQVPDAWEQQDLLDRYDDLLAIQCADGTWDQDPYMHGMANGMILLRSLVSGEKPTFLEAPKRWLNADAREYSAGYQDGVEHELGVVGAPVPQRTPLRYAEAHPREDQVKQAYELGRDMAERYDSDLTACVYGEDLDYILFNDLRSASWHAGFYGEPEPVWAEGWRLGDVPESGRSYNHRDNVREPGVSMMWVRDQHGNEYGTRDKISEMFIRSDGRDKVQYSGWLVGFGSDGEPCLLR